MNVSFVRKKRTFALLFLIIIVILFYNSDWIGRVMYPIHYKDEIRQASVDYQISPLFVSAIIRVESNYRSDKVSKKGAVGLMQLMPDTANWVAESAGYDTPLEDKLFDPVTNIDIGTRYVHSLLAQFGQSDMPEEDRIARAAAAYNAGPGIAGKWLESGVWTGKFADAAQIPYGETRHFVQRVVYYYNKYELYYSDSL